MSRLRIVCSTAALVLATVHAWPLRAEHRNATLVVTMTNDPLVNQIKVYDANTRALVQTLSTHGTGGVGGNARGVKQSDGELVAVVNYGSGTVALFRRDGDRLRFDRLVTTSSAPVSVDFTDDHMYVAGTSSVDSFGRHRDTVEWLDGTATLELSGGGAPPAGSTAQLGVLNGKQLLVTLKADPNPGTVDIVALHDGAVTGTPPTTVSAPPGSLTPFGFAVNRDGTALITLAHSNQDALFREGAFTAITAAGQAAPCWMTRTGKYVFTANTGSGTLSRLVGSGTHVFVDSPVAARLATGGSPTDLDADADVLGVIDHVAGQSHLSLYTYNRFGELTASGAPITIGVPTANGVAIMAQPDSDRR